MTVKIFNLACGKGHVFEGWFSDEDELQSQLKTGQIQCPVCGDASIEKRPSAPHVQTEEANQRNAARERFLMACVRELAGHAEDMGDRFADEARAIHSGHAKQRLIRGTCSKATALELVEEGIGLLPVPESVGKILN